MELNGTRRGTDGAVPPSVRSIRDQTAYKLGPLGHPPAHTLCGLSPATIAQLPGKSWAACYCLRWQPSANRDTVYRCFEVAPSRRCRHSR